MSLSPEDQEKLRLAQEELMKRRVADQSRPVILRLARDLKDSDPELALVVEAGVLQEIREQAGLFQKP